MGRDADSCPGEGQRSAFTTWARSTPTHTWHERMAVMFKKIRFINIFSTVQSFPSPAHPSLFTFLMFLKSQLYLFFKIIKYIFFFVHI